MFFLVSNPSHSKVFISIIRSFIHLGTTELSNYLGTTHLSVTCKAAPRCSSPRARRRDPMAAAVAAQPTPLCAASENRKQSGPRMREHTVRAQDPGPHDPPPPTPGRNGIGGTADPTGPSVDLQGGFCGHCESPNGLFVIGAVCAISRVVWANLAYLRLD